MEQHTEGSLLLPSFLRKISDPTIKTVMLCGCGGGFDFVHGLNLYPELMRLGKKVVIGSYSFGNPKKIEGATTVFDRDGVVARRVTSENVADAIYGPEVHVCSYLDSQYPDTAPHQVYAYYARAFTSSLIVSWIRDCSSIPECYSAFFTARDELGDRLRDVENLPRHEEMRG